MKQWLLDLAIWSLLAPYSLFSLKIFDIPTFINIPLKNHNQQQTLRGTTRAKKWSWVFRLLFAAFLLWDVAFFKHGQQGIRFPVSPCRLFPNWQHLASTSSVCLIFSQSQLVGGLSHLKNISQIGSFPQVGIKDFKKIETTTQIK